jgi:MATE family multidrug resistance protein
VFIALAPAVGHPREVMALNLASLALKVPLTWALIHGFGPFPELGGPGCGVASSAIAWLVALFVAARVRWGAPYVAFGVFRGSFRPDWKVMREILALGIPIGLTFLVDVTAYTFMALFLAPLGAVVSGAHQIIANLGAVAFMVPLSIGAGTQILVGHALGAGDRAKARRLAWLGVRVGLALALGVAALLLFGRGPIVALYTSDPEVAALAVSLLPLLALYHFGDALQGVIAQVLRAYRRAVMPMVAFIVTMWGFGLGVGYHLAFAGPPAALSSSGPLGAFGFWIAEAFGIALLGILLVAYLARVMRAATT